MLNQIVDGFTIALDQRPNPYSFNILALGQMDVLRRAKGYVPKHYAVPDWTDPQIALYDTIQRQIQIRPGSYIWAITIAYQPDSTNIEGDYYIYIRDDSTGLTFFEQTFVQDHLILFMTGGVGPLLSSYSPPKLAQPRAVLGTGLYTVQISRSRPNDPLSKIQVVLNVAEPCGDYAPTCDPCND
jgi:hypothetical protein